MGQLHASSPPSRARRSRAGGDRRAPRRGGALALPSWAWMLLAVAAGPAFGLQTTATVDPDGYTSARICGDCHQDIYNTWKNSLHAFSLTDPIFDTAYMEAVRDGGEEAKRLCLACHAPMTLVNQDYDLELGVTREGVSCDFCHTVTAVHLGNPAKPYSVELGLVKRSILRETDSPAHEVAYSELHERSEFCGGCHNYVAPNGTPLMTTYDEWKAGPYSQEGVHCQDCHMVLGEGRTVREDLRRSGEGIHVHSLIHDTRQLREALELEILSVDRSRDRLVVQIRVENVGSGHKMPTGIPTREVVLQVTVEGSLRTQSREMRYRRVIGDEKYRALESDAQVLLAGATVVSDNRIAPREKRIERIVFGPPGPGTTEVRARLSYRYRPLILKRENLEVQLGEAEKRVY